MIVVIYKLYLDIVVFMHDAQKEEWQWRAGEGEVDDRGCKSDQWVR